MPAELNEILDEWRNASGPHIVQASEMRRMAAEVDRLRDASPSVACGKCGQQIYIPGLGQRGEADDGR